MHGHSREGHDDSFALLARRVVPGGRLLRSWALEGGVSASMHALEIEAPDGAVRKVVSRRHGSHDWKPGTAGVTAREFALLEVLHREGLPVPEPCFLDESGELFPTPYLVTSFVEGTTEVSDEERPSALQQMAAFLSNLHAVQIEGPLLALPPLEDPLLELGDSLPSSPLTNRVRTALSGASAAISKNPRSLVHGDFWPGNVLWQHGRLASVVDWEDAALGDPLADLACSRVELLCRYGEAAMESFTRHYLSLRTLDLFDLPLWELYVSSAAAATMAQWGLEPAVEAARRRLTLEFLEKAAHRWLASVE